jgi:hypothetical protein
MKRSDRANDLRLTTVSSDAVPAHGWNIEGKTVLPPMK